MVRHVGKKFNPFRERILFSRNVKKRLRPASAEEGLLLEAI
jgi:hypothetical protein